MTRFTRATLPILAGVLLACSPADPPSEGVSWQVSDQKPIPVNELFGVSENVTWLLDELASTGCSIRLEDPQIVIVYRPRLEISRRDVDHILDQTNRAVVFFDGTLLEFEVWNKLRPLNAHCSLRMKSAWKDRLGQLGEAPSVFAVNDSGTVVLVLSKRLRGKDEFAAILDLSNVRR